MNTTELYERYHTGRKLQKRIISKDNFTYRNLIPFVDRYFRKNKVLDIGCGVGTIDFYLSSKGHNVTGVDISSRAVNLAKRNIKVLNLKIKPKFLNTDFLNAKIKERFDCILVSEVLEHLEKDGLAVRRIFKLLKNNGILIATSPSKNAPLYRMGLLDDFDLEVGHLRRYTKKQFMHLFKDNGFKVVKISLTEGLIRNALFTGKTANILVRFIRGPISDLVSYIDDLTIPIFGESNIILVAKKK